MKRGRETLLLFTAILAVLGLFYVHYPTTPTGLVQFAPQLVNLDAGDCNINLTTPDTYLLTEDLSCGANGITINTSDVTLDCQGFTIFNNATPNAGNAIRTLGAQQDITIQNCQLSGFQRGISLSTTTDNTTITNNTIFNITITAGTPIGIQAAHNGENITITNNTIYDIFDDGGVQGTGMTLGDSLANRYYVANNLVHTIGQVGITIEAANSTIINNTLRNNSVPGGNQFALGITLADNILVQGNTFFNNSDQSVEIDGDGNNFTFTNNTITHSGYYGILLDVDATADVTITNNIIKYSNQENVNFGNAGIFVEDSDAGTVMNNIITLNDGAGIKFDNSFNINISNNTISANNDAGINFTNSNDNVTIQRNQINENRFDGIYMAGTATNISIISNNASFNNQSGFESTGGTFKAFRDNIFIGNRGGSTGANVIGGPAAPAEEEPPIIVEGFGPQALIAGANLNITNNTALNNNGSGLIFQDFNGTNFYNNTAAGNNGSGFEFIDTNNVTVRNNDANNNLLDGYTLNGTSNISVEFNRANENSRHGFNIVDANTINVTDNNATNNAERGFAMTAFGIDQFTNNRAIGNRGTNTGGAITALSMAPVSGGGGVCTQFAVCTDDGDCGSGECDDPDGDNDGFCDCAGDPGFCGAGAATPDATACQDFPPASVLGFTPQIDFGQCADAFGAFCSAFDGGCCVPPVFSITGAAVGVQNFHVQALANPNSNISNNIALNNNGSGWVWIGFNTTNFINNSAINNSGAAMEFINVSLSIIEDNTGNNNSEGIIFQNSTNNTLLNNNMNVNQGPGLAFQDSSENNTVRAFTITANDTWLYTNPSAGNNATNLTFNNSFGQITITGNITIPDTVNVSTGNLTIAQNRAFLDSVNASFLNTTAHITLLGVVGNIVQVAFDDINFNTCNAPQCTNVVFAGGNVDFDVASFTTYQAGQAGAPGTGASGGGSGGYHSGTICPPSCNRLTTEELMRIPYCQNLCPEKIPAAPVKQKPAPVQKPAQTDTSTGIVKTEAEPSRKTIQEPALTHPRPSPELESAVKEAQAAETNYKSLQFLFYALALLAILGIWMYTHHKHLKHEK